MPARHSWLTSRRFRALDAPERAAAPEDQRHPVAGSERRGVAGRGPVKLRVPPGTELLAVLQWNEPFGAARRDFDLLLARTGQGDDVVLAASTEVQNGTGDPYEALRWVNDTGAAVNAYLAIAEFAAAGSSGVLRFDLNVFSHGTLGLEYVVARDSIVGHAAVEEVLSVAAAAAEAS